MKVPVLRQVWQNVETLFRAPALDSQAVLLQIDRTLNESGEPLYHSRMRLRVLRDERTARLTVLLTELSFLGETVLLSGRVRGVSGTEGEEMLARGELRGAGFHLVLDELAGTARLAVTGSVFHFGLTDAPWPAGLRASLAKAGGAAPRDSRTAETVKRDAGLVRRYV